MAKFGFKPNKRLDLWSQLSWANFGPEYKFQLFYLMGFNFQSPAQLGPSPLYYFPSKKNGKLMFFFPFEGKFPRNTSTSPPFPIPPPPASPPLPPSPPTKTLGASPPPPPRCTPIGSPDGSAPSWTASDRAAVAVAVEAAEALARGLTP